MLTGADWGSVRGLLALRPEPDRNVIYSFHLYEPPELTALGAYRPGLDTAAMARLAVPSQRFAAVRGDRRRHRRLTHFQPDPVLLRNALGRGQALGAHHRGRGMGP